ncbi:Fur family transcriptional regulator [Paralimibaculum aggregatum]|uniref:Fur family transcriptional regulator n=1 Tax=Paralimibaculum aggregatum TaxID=3036245 RepID=UPI0025524C2D|nr:Fur family transcriptional regulator [Limibaculum sp. NKW23]
MQPDIFARHDHGDCVRRTLETVEADCTARGLRLTALRRRVLEILLEAHRALGAYDVLARLAEEGYGSQPPVAYRALDFLVAHGFAHKLQRLNAFVACAHPGERHRPAFLICRTCLAVQEAHLDMPSEGIAGAAEAVGFTVERVVVEAEGLCPECQAAERA